MEEGNRTAAQQPLKNRVIKANTKTLAARCNTKLLRGLEAALKEDPEARISALLPSNCSEKLEAYRKTRMTSGSPAKVYTNADMHHPLRILT
jgi:hypothetical protein